MGQVMGQVMEKGKVGKNENWGSRIITSTDSVKVGADVAVCNKLSTCNSPTSGGIGEDSVGPGGRDWGYFLSVCWLQKGRKKADSLAKECRDVSCAFLPTPAGTPKMHTHFIVLYESSRKVSLSLKGLI